jgi:phospholipase C
MIRKNLRWMSAVLLAVNLVVAMSNSLMAQSQNPAANFHTTTPIKHLVVIFQENVSFDHYFASYPNAQNLEGETPFHGKKDTPAVNGLTGGLTSANPNTDYPPFRLDPAQNYTCSQNHDYTHEQEAFDSGLMDKFPEFTANVCTGYPDVQELGAAIVMGWFDGNTVTAEWNYAQHFAMDQNFFGTNFGPSTVGAINVISGMTGNVDLNHLIPGSGFGDDITYTNDGKSASVTGDPDPYWDDCGAPDQASVLGKNIGDLLNARKITWGWFQGGFAPSAVVGGIAQCNTSTNRIDGTPETAYSAHHDPFEYYFSTANIHHTPPKNLSEVGHDGAANHQYDLSYFWKVVENGNLPAVSYLKANRAQDGHPGNSSPLDEQQFIVKVINGLQASSVWDSTAVIITYDDSDGWYDHVIGPIVNQSMSVNDALTGAGMCGTGASSLGGIQARCGYGPRLPFLVISPFAKENFVDSTLTDQSSVVRFIEDNWDLGRIGPGSFDQIAGPITNMFDFKHPRTDRVFLDPNTGQVLN